MPAVQVVHPSGYAAERAYVARVLLGEYLGLDVEVGEAPVQAWEVRCGEGSFTIPDVLFQTPERTWLTHASLPGDGDLYGEDVFGSAFFLLTRYEEAVRDERDEHGRFPAEASILVREEVIERPLVNEYGEALWRQLLELAPRLERRQRTFRVVPSHDVDYPYSTLRQRVSAIRQGQLRAALPRDPFDSFDLLMDESERRGLRAAFYFIPDDAPYSLDEPRIRELLRRIHLRGHEIGYHASYHAFQDAERTQREFERLLAVCRAEGIKQDHWGGRHHFLRWEPATWAAWEEAGLAYDSTVGFTNRPGFRAGACFEYPVFDLHARRELRLHERPLVLMDTPTLDRQELPDEELVHLIDRLRDQCRRYRGDFTVLWHNNWLVTERQRRLLRAALER
ncbi:MAG TPA: polysaccharide deacetylase family protein [Gaiellaceae bacterium]|nr:polysaccharide deacetylase family protein [Gaiellaceae bacterium]